MHGYNQYGYNNMNVHAQRYQYYFDIGRQLYGSMHPVAKWIDALALQGNNTDVSIFRDKINPSGREIPSKYAVENISRCQVTVMGAGGNGEVTNGVYTFYQRSPGGGGSSFQRIVEIELPNGAKAT